MEAKRRPARVIRAAAGIALVALGCAQDKEPPPGEVPRPAPFFAYITNDGVSGGSGSITVYRIDAESSDMRAVPGSPFAVRRNPRSIAFEPQGRYAYVPNTCTWDVSGFEADAATGVLRPLRTSPTTVGLQFEGPTALGFHPAARSLYVSVHSPICRSTSHRTLYLRRYELDEAGAFFERETVPVGEGSEVVVHPNGRFVYAAVEEASGGSGNISTMRLEADGAITTVGNTRIASPAGTVLGVEPRGELLLSNRGRSYRIDAATGALRLAGEAAFAKEHCCPAMAMAPDGRHFYVAGDDSLESMAVDRATGALRHVSAVAGPSGAGLYMHPSGRWLLTRSTRTVEVYPVEPATGILGASVSRASLDPAVRTRAACFSQQGLAIDPSGSVLLVPNCLADTVQVFAFDAGTGALRERTGSPLRTGAGPGPIVIRPIS